MTAKALMFMGTGSDVGKSLLVAGLCRAAANRGIKVAPFKPQNMSNNAAVTVDNGEIGRAQALQARAAKIEPTTAMNPVLLKPEHERGAQIIVRGKRAGSMPARQYFAERARYLKPVHQAFSELADDFNLILVEGAGSASEVNLRHNDIANFGFAAAADVPVIIIGDIERGGVIASLVGTLQVISADDAERVIATLINKFHGDPSLFETGSQLIAEQTGHACLGPVPHFANAHLLPAEDVLGLTDAASTSNNHLKIIVPRLPRIANFDDLDPLMAEPNVSVQIIERGNVLPADADLILLPGSKSTIADLQALQTEGWDIDIKAHVRRGGHVLGLCGGFQMLGTSIADPDGLEGDAKNVDGLGLLDVQTTLHPTKQLRVENGIDAQFGKLLSGYHMHLGDTLGPSCAKPFAHVDGVTEGARSENNLVCGTYLHGLFASDVFRQAYLSHVKAGIQSAINYDAQVETVLDELAEHLENHLDLEALFASAQTPTLSKD